MEVRTEVKQGTPVIYLSGEVDMFNSPKAREALQAQVKQKAPTIVVSLSAVSYIDSSGVATLVECLRGVKSYKGALKLVGVNPDIKDVFRIARLADVFQILETEEAALGGAAAPGAPAVPTAAPPK